MLKTPNHSYFRNFTYEKFALGFGAGYLLIRELPIRNFYARCVIMSVFVAKMYDHIDSFLPGQGLGFRVASAPDPYRTNELEVYQRADSSIRHQMLPSVQNDVQERTRWEGRYLLVKTMIDNQPTFRDKIITSWVLCSKCSKATKEQPSMELWTSLCWSWPILNAKTLSISPGSDSLFFIQYSSLDRCYIVYYWNTKYHWNTSFSN